MTPLFSQVAENQQLFRALKTLLEDLRSELQEDERARLRLQQQYAGDKAAWDMEWAVLKCRLEQVPPCPACPGHAGRRRESGPKWPVSERRRTLRRKPAAAARRLP